MRARAGVIALGAGITTSLLVAVVVIEAINVEFSAILGLPVGAVAGLFVLAGLWIFWEGLGPGTQLLASAYAAFGLSVLALLGLRYVNIGRDLFTVQVIVVISFVVAMAVLLFLLPGASDRGLV